MLKKFLKKILEKLKGYNHIKTLINKKKSKAKIKLGEKNNFYQEIIFLGEGEINIGDNSSFGYKIGGKFKNNLIELQVRSKSAKIIIGKNVLINNGLIIISLGKIIIGDYTLIGSNVTILDHNAHGIHPEKRRNYPGTPKEIIIGENVWIGNNSIILPGTKIGKNSIVGAGAVVSGEFPNDVIISGNPARIIKNIII